MSAGVGPVESTLLAAIMRVCVDALIVVDDEGRVVDLNLAAEGHFGRSREDCLGRPIGSFVVAPANVDARGAAGWARMAGRRVETTALRQDGQAFPVEATTAEVPADGRRVVVVCLRDLSERKAAEAALETSEARLAAFMRNAPIGMYLKDAQGRYVMANPEMEHVFGRPVAEVLGRSAADLLGPEAGEMVALNDRRVMETGAPQAVEEHLPGLDRYAWTLVMRFPVDWGGGEPARIGGFDIDITAIRRAEEELARSREALYQSEKLTALGSLLAGIAHELNNPLSIVVGQATLLEEDAAGTAYASRAEKIRRAAERCGRIVQSFLAMARRRPPELRAVAMSEIVQAALDIATYGLRSAGIAVTVDVPADLPLVHGDPDHLHQVVLNLLINAQQALEGRPQPRMLAVTGRAGADGRSLELDIADNGPGVAPDIRARIFEPFFTTKPMGRGTGVGLSFCHGVIGAHGGRLELMDGLAGALFRVALPTIAADAVLQPEVAAPPRAPVRACTALVIDDEEELAEMLAEMLTASGLEVTVATSGAQAQALLETRSFELVMSDLRMPGVDGPALHAWLRRHRPEMAGRIAFVTGDALGDAAARFLADADRPVLEKPFTREAVQRMLTAVLGATPAIGSGSDGTETGTGQIGDALTARSV